MSARTRARVCVCVSLSTGFVPVTIKPWRGGDLADWQDMTMQRLGVAIR